MRNILSAVMHGVVFLFYSAILWDALMFHGEGGGSLVWLFYLFIAYSLHIIILLITIAKSCMTKKGRIWFGVLSGIALLLLIIFCSLVLG